MSETKEQKQVLIITVSRGSMTPDEKASVKKELESLGLSAVFVEFNVTTPYPPRFDQVYV